MALPLLLTQHIVSTYEKLKYPIIETHDVHDIVMTSLKLSKVAIESFIIIRDQQQIIFFSSLALTIGIVSHWIANTPTFKTENHQQSTFQRGCIYLSRMCFVITLAVLAGSYYVLTTALSAQDKQVTLLTTG